MTATIDSTMTLPAQSHQSGAPIIEDDGNGGGVKQLARAINTAYEQVRVMAVGQAGSDDPTPDYIINGTSEVAYWRVKNLGYSGGENNNEVLYAYALVTLIETASGSATLTLTEKGNGDTAFYAYSSDVTETWVALGYISIDDDTEYLDLELEFTAASNMTTIEVHGFALYWTCEQTTLAAGAYSQNGVHPLHDEHVDDNSPMAAHIVHHMHRNVESIYQYRQGGNLVTTALGPDNKWTSAGEGSSAPVWIPPGVEQVKVWVYTNSESTFPSGAKTLSATLYSGGGVTIATGVISHNTTWIGGWESVTLDVATDYQEQWCLLTVVNGSQPLQINSVCAYTVNAVR